MTVQSLYRLLCDAPHCPAAEIRESRTTPEGWRRLSSTDHLDLNAYPVNPRPRSNKLSRSAALVGSFSLMLCPNHHGAFDTHRPQTRGGGTTRGGSDIVYVSCSCGARFPWTTAVKLIGAPAGPSYNPERAWWAHLPEDLRWYATREPCRDELHGGDGGPCPPCKHDSHPIPSGPTPPMPTPPWETAGVPLPHPQA